MTVQFNEEKQKRRLDDIRKKEEEGLVKFLAGDKYHIPYIDLGGVLIENEALRYVTEKEAREIEVAPFKITGENIYLAVKSPERKEVQLLKKKLQEKGYIPLFYMASQSSLDKVWNRYKELSFASRSDIGSLDISGDILLSLGKKIKTIEDIEKTIKETVQLGKTHAISKMLEIIFAGAISINASDIHIEPEEDRIRLRFRLDGVLHDIMFFDHHKYKLLNSRIKLLSGLKLTTTQQAQDGRFSIILSGIEINIRTSIIPGSYGESIVLRILNPKSIQGDLDSLGIDPGLLKIFKQEISKPNGMILTTGPTGSGKTTTLYSFLRKVYSPGIKIITIEDPIEYHLDGITQTQTNKEKGYTFLEGLRSALRQDPDIIMVGEIRDEETAKIAVNAALTGHIVFSTLHTNNAAGAIPRLIDLGVNPKTLTSALSLSIAQRLVRKLCINCKKEKVPNREEMEKIKLVLSKALLNKKDLSFYGINKETRIEKIWEPIGCSECNNIGYKGRIGVFETILSDENIENIAIKNPSEREIKKIAKKQGIIDMKEDGVLKVLAGITSLEEVEHVIDLTED